MNRHIITIIIVLLLTGCSAGKPGNFHKYNYEISFLTKDLKDPQKANVVATIPAKKLKFTENNQHTLFIHPGLMFGIDWGGSRANDAGLKLIKDGYYSKILEVRSRKSPPMYEQMIKDNAQSYLGIHYSMGGSPAVVSEALKASKKASNKLDKTFVYNAILVDPFGFADFSKYIDPDSPNLGTVFIIASSNYSFLRPDIKSVSSKISNHEKIHYIYPEDFGLSWDHFGFLSAIRDNDNKNLNSLKVRGIFYFLVNAIHQEAEANTIEYGLQQLKDNYRLIENIADANQILGDDLSLLEVSL